MTDARPHTLGVRAVGKVDKEEYESILLPAFRHRDQNIFTHLIKNLSEVMNHYN